MCGQLIENSGTAEGFQSFVGTMLQTLRWAKTSPALVWVMVFIGTRASEQSKRPAVPPCRIVVYGFSGRSGKSSSIRLLGQTGNFSSVSFSQACGSSPFSLAVPNRL